MPTVSGRGRVGDTGVHMSSYLAESDELLAACGGGWFASDSLLFLLVSLPDRPEFPALASTH